MKAKKIGIVHTKDFYTYGAVAKVFNKLIDELKSEGKAIKRITNHYALFDDGSTIVKFGMKGLIGTKVTHVYIDEGIYELDNGEEIVNKAVLPFVMVKDKHENFDVEGNAEDRVFTFDTNGLIIKSK